MYISNAMQTADGDRPEIFKTTWDNFLLPAVLLLAIVWGTISCLQDGLMPYGFLIAPLTALIIGAAYLYHIYSRYALHLYPDRLEIVNMRGNTVQTIYRDELTGWSLIKYEGRHPYTSFTLLSHTRRYRFVITRYSRYEAIVRLVTKGLPRDAEREKTVLYRQGLAIAWALGILIAAMLIIAIKEFLVAN